MIEKTINTLCLIHNPPRILLGMKKRGFGQGRWNGFGGKIEIGETIEQAAQRETFEEAGIKVSNMERIGILRFIFPHDEKEMETHIFRATEFEGEPTETEEMKPKWFNTADIPLDDMWPDDRYWMPLFLNGKKFTGTFEFGPTDNIHNFKLWEKEPQSSK